MRSSVRSLVALVALVGCESRYDARPDAPPATLSLDVTVTSRSVAVYPNGTVPGLCDDEMAHFAAPDTCIDIDDEIQCSSRPASCLSVELTGTGVMPSGFDATLPGPLSALLPDVFPPDLVLRVGGCGHLDVEIPVEPFVAPTPTVTADVTDTLVTARWQTDAPVASAYVSFGFHTYAHDCHMTAPEASFMNDVPVMPGSGSVAVTAFLPVQIVESPNREIRIWRGGFGYTQL